MSGFYEYKGYAPETEDVHASGTQSNEPEKEKSIKQREQLGLLPTISDQSKPLPEDVQQLFNKLNTTGLAHHRDPLCVDQYYTKNKYRFSVVPEEKRVQGTPQQISTAYESWYLNDWKQRSRIHKIFSILWYLPAHFYRKYLATVDYRFYYNGLVSFLGRKRDKIKN
jgi:hypothetical protein